MDGGFLFALIGLFVFGFLLLFVGDKEEQTSRFLAGGFILVFCGALLGDYMAAGYSLTVNSSGSEADLVVGHSYETLAKVPSVQREKVGSGIFWIKDDTKNLALLINIAHENLPPRFIVDEKGGIVAITPAPPSPPLELPE